MEKIIDGSDGSNGIIVRLLSIELRNFKNVGYGKIEFPSAVTKTYFDGTAEILGIYGQNGSGKTAAIDALGFAKRIMSGLSLPENTSEYISTDSDCAECGLEFYICRKVADNADSDSDCGADIDAEEESADENDECYIVSYSYVLNRTDNKTDGQNVYISHEKLSFREIKNGNISAKIQSVCFDSSSEEETGLSPKTLRNRIISSDRGNFIGLAVQKKLSEKDRKSFIFSDDIGKIFETALGENDKNLFFMSILKEYATECLYIIRAKLNDDGKINFNLPAPYGKITISLSEPAVLPNELYRPFAAALSDTDRVMSSVIPGIRFKIKEYGYQLSQNGSEEMRFEIVSVRGDSEIPLKYESDGIKKLLSVFNILISMYNNASFCVVIDELDAGIYEYLFGELIEIIDENGLGQLLFTSHNLRPLETVDRDMLVFTTTNKSNRYIRFAGSRRSSKNLRDLYLRSIDLGGQKEEIYRSTNAFEINRAFRTAGRNTDNGKKE